jgi:hypothetical protein
MPRAPISPLVLIAACTVANCLNCRANHSDCDACNTGANYYLDDPNNVCVLISAIPNTFGPNLGNGKVETCSVGNCLECKTSHLICDKCNVAGSYFKNVTSGHCLFVSSIPIGQGANTTTGIIETCWTSFCKNCQSESASCLLCDVISGYYKNTTNGQCQEKSTAADFYGPNINSGLLSSCLDPNCKLCKEKFDECDYCDVPNHYYFNGTSLTCELSWTIETGFGGKDIDGLIYPCDSPGCNNCSTNFMECVTCDTSLDYYLDTTAHRCVLVDQIPTRYGADTGDGTIKSCDDLNCLWCKADYMMCTECDVGSSYFLDTTVENCVLVTNIPAGYGANTTTGILETCWPSNCLICQSNSSQCDTCNTLLNYFLNTTSFTCILNTSIIDGFGPNTGTGYIEQCTDNPACLKCKYKHNECDGCDVANSYYLNTTSHSCVLQANMPDGSGIKAIDGTVAFCQDGNCIKCVSNYSQCTACNTAASFYLNTLTKTCTHQTLIVDFSGANLTTGIISECKVDHCRKCKANNALCSQCDTLTLYYMRNSTGTCVYYNDIEDSYGADIISGRIARCQDLNCLKCQAAIEQCQGCDMNNGYFLNTTLMGCVTIQSIADGYGGDLVNGLVIPCAVVGCKDCRTDSSSCAVCDTANHYYLNTSSSTCVIDSTLPDFLGPNLADGYIEECQPFGCRICNMDSTKCQQCKTNEGYYKDALEQCVLYSDIADFKGADVLLGTISNCQLPNCKFCKKDHNICTGCDTSIGLYMNAAGDGCTDNFPEGFGPDVDNGAIKACSDKNCKICAEDFATCSLCDTAKSFYLDGSACSPAAKAPKGMGLNKTTSLLDPCEIEFCQNCGLDYQLCNSCYENMGYYLEGNLCVLMDAKLEIKESSSKPTGISLSFIAGTTPSLTVDNKHLFAELRKQLDWNITFLKSTTEKSETVDLKRAMTSSELGVTIDLTVQSKLEEKSYKVNVSFSQKYYNVTMSDSTLLRISGGKGQFSYKSTAAAAEEAKGAGDSGSAVNNAMGGSIASSPAFLPVMMAVVALDPTGVLMKFNQILKIINKLYFININYGIRLDAFLKGMGEQTANLTKEESDEMIKQLDRYRGKLTKDKIPFDFLANMNYKIGLYLGVWFMWIINFSLRTLQVKVAKWYLHVMYWSDKVHLIIFNLVFIDFIWYGAHTMLHARGRSIVEQSIACLCLLLIAVDVSFVVAHMASQRDWLYWILLRRKIDQTIAEEKKTIHFEELKNKRKKNKEIDSTNNLKSKEKKKEVLKRDKNEIESDEEDDYSKKKKGLKKEKTINYKLTFEDISSNYHLYIIVAANLSPLARVYLHPFARSLYMNHIFRTIVYQGTILACQYSSGMAITTLVLVEIYRIAYSTFFYVKYKYLKNIICLLMEVMQSSLLLCFLVLAMILHPKTSDEIILDFYQDAGIWIVIASCVAEYLLLLTYIGVAAYDFFKNRKSVNRAMKRLKLSFIKYGKDPAEVFRMNNPDFYGDVAKIVPLKAHVTLNHILPFEKPKDINNYSDIVAPLDNSNTLAYISKPIGMPVASVIGKSKNKFNLSQHIKNKFELKAQKIPKSDLVNNLNQVNATLEMDNQSRRSTSNSLKKIKSPLTSALKRIQTKPQLKTKDISNISSNIFQKAPVSITPADPPQEKPAYSLLKPESGSPLKNPQS